MKRILKRWLRATFFAVLPARFPALFPAKHNSNADLDAVYTDRNGYRYYRYRDLLKMPMKRLIALETAGRYLELNLTRERLLGMIAALEQQAQTDDKASLYRIIAEMRLRVEGVVEEEVLLNSAAVYFIREDEDASGYDAAFQKIKLAGWRADPQATAFFLSGWLQWAANWSEASANEWLATLEHMRPWAEALNRLSLQTK